MNTLDVELAYRSAQGHHPVTVGQMNKILRSIGYELNRSRDCHSVNRYMTGPRAGLSYPTINTGVREVDTKLEFCNIDARRDKNFEVLQQWRGECSLFSVVRGSILEI